MGDRLQSQIAEHPLNREIYGEDPSDDLVESIRRFGVFDPIIVSRRSWRIISGHRRYRACQTLGIDIPYDLRSFNDDLEEEEAIIEANRQREKTATQIMREVEHLKNIVSQRAKQQQGTRTDLLSNVDKKLNPIHTRDEVSEKVGLSKGSFARLEQVYNAAQNGDEGAKKLLGEVDQKKRTINSAYTVFKNKKRRQELHERIKLESEKMEIPADIQFGDYADLITELGDKTIDAVITSPPFKNEDIGVEDDEEYYEWFTGLLKELGRVTIDYLLIFNNPTRLIEICRRTDPHRILIWNKTVVQYPWRYEPIFIYKLDTARYNINDRIWSDVLPYQPPVDLQHPFQNPVELYDHLLTYVEAQTILDPFLGSGTTLKACRKRNIRCVGFEIDEKQIPLIKNAGVE